MDWQESAALAIVGLTAALFVRRLLRRPSPTCGKRCACPKEGLKIGDEGGILREAGGDRRRLLTILHESQHP